MDNNTTTDSLKTKDNQSTEDNELLALFKENKWLLMEKCELLKQAECWQYKTAENVMKALSQIKPLLSSIGIFYSD